MNRDTNWHTMLYVVRCAVAITCSSSHSFYTNTTNTNTTTTTTSTTTTTRRDFDVLNETRQLFEQLRETALGKVERGYWLASLEICRECQKRNWEQGEQDREFSLSLFPLSRSFLFWADSFFQSEISLGNDQQRNVWNYSCQSTLKSSDTRCVALTI